MKFEDYELIHKSDLLVLRDRISELEQKNRDLMDPVDVKRLWLIDKAEKRLDEILRVDHQLAAKWKEVAGDPKE